MTSIAAVDVGELGVLVAAPETSASAKVPDSPAVGREASALATVREGVMASAGCAIDWARHMLHLNSKFWMLLMFSRAMASKSARVVGKLMEVRYEVGKSHASGSGGPASGGRSSGGGCRAASSAMAFGIGVKRRWGVKSYEPAQLEPTSTGVRFAHVATHTRVLQCKIGPSSSGFWPKGLRTLLSTLRLGQRLAFDLSSMHLAVSRPLQSQQLDRPETAPPAAKTCWRELKRTLPAAY